MAACYLIVKHVVKILKFSHRDEHLTCVFLGFNIKSNFVMDTQYHKLLGAYMIPLESKILKKDPWLEG